MDTFSSLLNLSMKERLMFVNAFGICSCYTMGPLIGVLRLSCYHLSLCGFFPENYVIQKRFKVLCVDRFIL